MQLTAVASCLLVLATFCMEGCTTNGARIDRVAAVAGLQKHVITGALHSQVVYEKVVATSQPGRLFVFLDGDGNPWSDSGMRPATDPTTRNPVALRLLVATDASGIYVARPCYQGHVDDHCTSDSWTSGRYSEEIVGSMISAIRNEADRLRADELVIVGYSGGGVLAVLSAERLPNVSAVITVGANLDIIAWANHHGFLPLTRSLNPAQSERPHPWNEFHFSGADDSVVPIATADRYFQRYPHARRIVIEKADHVCCWERDWPSLLEGLPLDPTITPAGALPTVPLSDR